MKRKILILLYIIMVICFIFFNNELFENKRTRDTDILSVEDNKIVYTMKENGRNYKIIEEFNDKKTEIFATDYVLVNDKYLLYRNVYILEGENGFTEEKYNYLTVAILILTENIIAIILLIPVIIYFVYRKILKLKMK